MTMKEEPMDMYIYESLVDGLSNMVNAIDKLAIVGVAPCVNKHIGFAYIYLISFSPATNKLKIETIIYNYCKKHNVWLNRSDIGTIDTFSLVIQSEEDAYKLLALLRLEGY